MQWRERVAETGEYWLEAGSLSLSTCVDVWATLLLVVLLEEF